MTNGPYDSGRCTIPSIPGISKDSLPVTIKETGAKLFYTYGEYMRRFVQEAKPKAHPILVSLTPRNALGRQRQYHCNASKQNVWFMGKTNSERTEGSFHWI